MCYLENIFIRKCYVLILKNINQSGSSRVISLCNLTITGGSTDGNWISRNMDMTEGYYNEGSEA